ncbi:MAG TPA: NAD-dependent epimerase/dehydratase family protein [Candidatus Baltobacteraceae bacterium]|jgi:dTDP-glucose 4,6-dehydratase/UDP-glucuronate decarboxylase
MAVIVTGGAGFVGSHLVDRLSATEKNVIVMDDLSSGRIANLESALSSGRATFVYADIAQGADRLRDDVRAATTERITEIYHLASPASPEAYGAHPWETLSVNAIGTMSLIEIALEQQATLLFASTSEVYGDPAINPQPETYFGNVNPIGPRACYDEGKRFGEAAMSVASSVRGLNGRIVRLFNCYGPRMQLDDGRLIPSLIDAIMKNQPLPIHGSGEQTRSLTYVDDIVEGLIHVARMPMTRLLPVNLGNDEELSVLALAQMVCSVAGVPFASAQLPARPEDPQKRRPELSRARSFGWQPTTSVEDGLRKTYEWFMATALAYA